MDLEEMNIFLMIPKETIALRVVPTILKDGKPVELERTLGVQDIFKARQDFLDNVEDGDDYDAVYVLTDYGRQMLDEGLV